MVRVRSFLLHLWNCCSPVVPGVILGTGPMIWSQQGRSASFPHWHCCPCPAHCLCPTSPSSPSAPAHLSPQLWQLSVFFAFLCSISSLISLYATWLPQCLFSPSELSLLLRVFSRCLPTLLFKDFSHFPHFFPFPISCPTLLLLQDCSGPPSHLF